MKRAGAVLIALAAAAVPYTQHAIDALRGRFQAAEEVLYLPRGEVLRRLVPGFEDVTADLYWLRTVQYYGGQRAFAADKNYRLLEPLARITVALDPRFEIAYRYGAVFLSEPKPYGAGDPQAGLSLIASGVAAMPENWRLRQTLGFFTFLYTDDHERAAEILLEAAEVPGAAFWLRNMAAMIIEKGGDRSASRRIWEEIYRNSEGPIQEMALLNLQRLDARTLAELIEQRVRSFEERQGRRPASLEELRRSGLLPVPPVDPAGVAFDYDREKGRVRIARSSPLWTVDVPVPRLGAR